MDDLISRQAALKAVDWDSEAYSAIINLPVIDPVKHGRWVEHGWEWHKCSVCGATAPSDEVVNEYLTPYCPYCGTSMDEVEDETH